MHLDPKEALFASLRERFGPAHNAAPEASPLPDAGGDEALHPPEALLHAHRQGWVTGPLRDDLRRHLGGCPHCRQRFAALHLDDNAQDQSPAPRAASESPQPAEASENAEATEAPEALAQTEVSASTKAAEAIASEHEPALGMPAEKHEGPPPSSLRWWRVPASLGALGLALWLVLPLALPPETIVPSQPRPFSGLKGKRPQWTKGIEQLYADFATRALLHLGVVDGPGLPVRRLHRDSICDRRQSLFFGFSLARPGGYVYLFRVDPRGQATPELLYPFSPTAHVRKDGGTVHIIERAGVTQRYPLRGEPRDVLFVLVQRATPLTPSQQRGLLGRKTGWDSQLTVLRQTGLSGGSFDRFLVRLQARNAAPGEQP